MNKARFLHGKEGLARVLVMGGVLGLFGFAQNQSSPPRSLVQPESPGVPPIGLEFFRLQPTVPDTTFRLLVIPVQFPEDGVLGGGSPEQILEKLNGNDRLNLAGYYAHETVGRLHIVSTLAPLVIAPHSRAYYTTEGGAYGSNGLDPSSYPHNGQGLVDDVTRVLTDRVDFRQYDNTEDGIVDGLLILHSGPESAETSAGALPADVLVAHAFTLPVPASRGGSMIFPYALAATRDGIGVWAHEVGHLFGLPDLYVANSVCFGPGLGEWSLMATGANRNGGDNPTGLDAFSLQLLGMTPRFDDGNGVTLSQGVFLRASDPGEEVGPRYYLVDFREAGDGPAGSTPSRVVYLVNEEAVDNRSCSNPPESYRPLVRVAGVVCPGDTACAQSYYQSCELCPNVGFTFSGTTVHVQSGALPPILLSRVQLEAPQNSSGTEEQRVLLSFHNVDLDQGHAATIDVSPMSSDSVCLAGPPSRQIALASNETSVDSSLTLVHCVGSGSLPRVDLSLLVRITDTNMNWTRQDTVLLPANHVGLKGLEPNDIPSCSDWCDFEIQGSWSRRVSGLGQTIIFHADYPPLANGTLVSPWFSIPPRGGQFDIDHVWNLTALSPDVALDAGQVRLQLAVGTEIVLEPPFGWGYTAERSVGNILGGQTVLSGSGWREHQVFDVSDYAGQVARVVFVAAGDATSDSGSWDIYAASVTPPPDVAFSLELDPSGSLMAVTTDPPHAGTYLTLYRGLPGIAPTDTAFIGTWKGEPRMALGHFEGPESRFELVWTDSTGAASVGAIFNLPVTPAQHFLLAPSPNPVHNGEGQNWALRVPDDAPPGTYTLRLVSLDGSVLLERSVRIDQPGTRLIPWDGLDGEGRTISSGIYFLEARRPDGVRNGQRIVVLP
jgi:M6 family metalloprotease-like protein